MIFFSKFQVFPAFQVNWQPCLIIKLVWSTFLLSFSLSHSKQKSRLLSADFCYVFVDFFNVFIIYIFDLKLKFLFLCDGSCSFFHVLSLLNVCDSLKKKNRKKEKCEHSQLRSMDWCGERPLVTNAIIPRMINIALINLGSSHLIKM